jgi:hypothetical protein
VILLKFTQKGVYGLNKGQNKGEKGQLVKNPFIRGMLFQKGSMWQLYQCLKAQKLANPLFSLP